MNGYSILICCYNSENRIEETLTALLKLERKNIEAEIIIVDNASTDATSMVADKFLKDKDFAYSIKHEKIAGKTNAILKGLNIASYDKIVFCDDDVLLSKNYLTEAEKVFSSDDKIGILGGKGLVKDSLILPKWFANFENAYAVGEQWTEDGDITLQKGYVWGAGCIFRKAAWNEIIENGFKRFYTGVQGTKKNMTGEDSELCLWVIFSGFKLWYAGALTYTHNLEQERLSWNYLLLLNVGFARSQLYLDLIETIMYSKKFDFQEYRKAKLSELRKELFRSFFTIIYFKSLWISYIEKRPGYAITFNRNNTIVKMKELLFKRHDIMRISKDIQLAIADSVVRKSE